MKFTPVQIAAASVAGTLAVVGLGVSIHSASVHEQNCLSYERQLASSLDALQNQANKAKSMLEIVQEQPLLGFGLIAQLPDLETQTQRFGQNLNNAKYAYVKVCGQNRFDTKVVPALEAKKAKLNQTAAEIKAFRF
jgi:hypothetical protein